MSKVVKEFDSIMMGKYGSLVLYSSVVGLALSNKIPTPNALLGKLTFTKLKGQYERGDLSTFEYKEKVNKALNIYSNVWWAGVLGAMFFTKGNAYDKAKIGALVIGGGIVASLLIKKPDLSQKVLLDGAEDDSVNFDSEAPIGRSKMMKFL